MYHFTILSVQVALNACTILYSHYHYFLNFFIIPYLNSVPIPPFPEPRQRLIIFCLHEFADPSYLI